MQGPYWMTQHAHTAPRTCHGASRAQETCMITPIWLQSKAYINAPYHSSNTRWHKNANQSLKADWILLHISWKLMKCPYWMTRHALLYPGTCHKASRAKQTHTLSHQWGCCWTMPGRASIKGHSNCRPMIQISLFEYSCTFPEKWCHVHVGWHRMPTRLLVPATGRRAHKTQ